MGYTHYYYLPGKMSQSAWLDVVQAVSEFHDKFVKLYPEIQICGSRGEGLPQFSEDLIAFNGGPGHSCESFIARLNTASSEEFNFIKTNQRPYDLFVCVVLILFNRIVNCRIGSDGTSADWKQAINLYNSLYGTELTYDDLF